MKSALFTLVIAAGCLASAAAEEEVRDVTIVVAGQIITGKPVLPADEKDFFIIKDGQKLGFRWDQLDAVERRRVQRLYKVTDKAEAVEGEKKIPGNEVDAVRYKLASGKTVEGLPLPDRDRPGQKALRTVSMPLMLIAESEITSKETFKGREGDYFTPQEIYDRWLAENPPKNDDAAAHLAFAKKAEELGLFDIAVKHLESAALIDPRTEERNKEYKASLAKRQSEKPAQELFAQVLRDMRAGNNFDALEKLDRLERSYKFSELRSRWEALRPQVIAATKADIGKQVVQLSYIVADEIIQRRMNKKVRVDEKGNVVPSIPGKQVTTKNGDVLRGTMEGEVAESGPVTLNIKGTVVTIARPDIVSMMDVDLSVAAREIDPTFDDLKQWISNASGPDSLKGQTMARIAQLLRVKEKKVHDIFDERLKREAEYVDGRLTNTPVYATIHTASYGKGSWLRDGARFTPSAGPRTNTLTRYRTRTDETGRRIVTRTEEVEQKSKEEAEDSDEPNVWWTAQEPETRLGVLRGIAGEKLFKLKNVENIGCKECGGKGEVVLKSALGGTDSVRCRVCRGLKALYRVNYE